MRDNQPLRKITPEEIAAYRENGVVKLSGIFGMEWIEHLREATQAAMGNPGPHAEEYAKEEGRFFGDLDVAKRQPAFRDFVLNSPAAEIAGTIMEASRCNFAAYEWPYRSALDAGVVVASSSDAPVTAGNWLQGIATCMDRIGKQSGEVSGPEQRIGLDEAIRTYTWAGAWQDRAEDYKGSLEIGKVADFVVLDENLASLPTDKFANVKTAMTLVDGKTVHDQLSSA